MSYDKVYSFYSPDSSDRSRVLEYPLKEKTDKRLAVSMIAHETGEEYTIKVIPNKVFFLDRQECIEERRAYLSGLYNVHEARLAILKEVGIAFEEKFHPLRAAPIDDTPPEPRTA